MLKSSLNLDKFNKAALAGGILLIGASLFYYLVIFLPQKEESIQEQHKQEEIKVKEKEFNLDQCLEAAQVEQERSNEQLIKWAKEDNQDGKYNLRGAFDSIKKQYEQDRAECFKKYPLK